MVLHFGHYLQVFEGVASSAQLCNILGITRSLANGHRQCRQLYQALKVIVVRLLFDVNVGDFELLLAGNFLQELDEVELRIVEACGLVRKGTKNFGMLRTSILRLSSNAFLCISVREIRVMLPNMLGCLESIS